MLHDYTIWNHGILGFSGILGDLWNPIYTSIYYTFTRNELRDFMYLENLQNIMYTVTQNRE